MADGYETDIERAIHFSPGDSGNGVRRSLHTTFKSSRLAFLHTVTEWVSCNSGLNWKQDKKRHSMSTSGATQRTVTGEQASGGKVGSHLTLQPRLACVCVQPCFPPHRYRWRCQWPGWSVWTGRQPQTLCDLWMQWSGHLDLPIYRNTDTRMLYIYIIIHWELANISLLSPSLSGLSSLSSPRDIHTLHMQQMCVCGGGGIPQDAILKARSLLLTQAVSLKTPAGKSLKLGPLHNAIWSNVDMHLPLHHFLPVMTTK